MSEDLVERNDRLTRTQCCQCDRVAMHWIANMKDGKEVEIPMCCRHYGDVVGGTLPLCFASGDTD